MAKFTLTWDNTDILASANNTGQRVSYREKSVGGPWFTDGFTPANHLAKSVTSVVTKVLDPNKIWEFKVEALCTENGPVQNDNGIKENIGFSCLVPVIVNSETTSNVTVDLTGTDISKVRFTLKKASDNSVVYGPTTITRTGNLATTTASSLTATTSYYWEIILFATINGVEVNSGLEDYINGSCGPYNTTTSSPPPAELDWIPLAKACETEGSFAIIKTISGLSSPFTTWYDVTLNRVWVADRDNPSGLVYWFNPDTATTIADVTFSAAVPGQTMYNAYIDPVYRRIYFVGLTNGGLTVYDMDTNTASLVAFGSNTAFGRLQLVVSGDRILCNDGNTSLVLINRSTLAIISTLAVGTLTNPAHFNTGPYVIIRCASNGNYYVCSNNSNFNTIGVYDQNFTHVGEITLTGAATWSFGKYWQVMFYDEDVDLIYASDIGSNRRYVINPDSNTVTHNILVNNREGKSNVMCTWSINPVTRDLYMLWWAWNSSSDVNPIKRTYLIDRTTHQPTNMFEGKYFNNLSGIVGTDKAISCDPGQPVWSGSGVYNTDGSISILSASANIGNTGNALVLTLQEIDLNNGNLPTGNVKDNVPGEVDYVPPTQDLSTCPITYTVDCPTEVATTYTGGALFYEFAIKSSVRNNPNIAKITVQAFNTFTNSLDGAAVTINAPFLNNYYSGSIAGLVGLNYTIRIKYYNSADVELQSC